MAPYEASYGRSCRSPICWIEMGECSITGPDMIKDTSKKVDLIRTFLMLIVDRRTTPKTTSTSRVRGG